MLLNNELVNNDIEEVIKNFLDTNEKEHNKAQNLWYTVKAVLRKKSIAKQAYVKKTETFQIYT